MERLEQYYKRADRSVGCVTITRDEPSCRDVGLDDDLVRQMLLNLLPPDTEPQLFRRVDIPAEDQESRVSA